MAHPETARPFDAIVVGSGMTGGWAAKELTELGLRTLVLEAGRPIDPKQDSREHVPAWRMPFRGRGDRRWVEAHQPVQQRSVSFDEWSHRAWVDDVETPYTTSPDKPFDWFRARQVGGKSVLWGRQVYRWSDLEPWYDRVERFIGVSGQAEGLSQLPDGPFLPPMEMNCVESHVRERMRARYGRQRVLTIGRVAVLTAPHGGRAACHYCGPCHRGCSTRSYFSSVNATLPAAQATGRLTLRPFSIVHSLVFDEGRGRHEHGDAGRLRVRCHLLEPVDDAPHDVVPPLAVGKPVGEHADVPDAERVREVDEAPALVEVLAAGGRLLVVHLGGGAEVGDDEAEGRQVLARYREARSGELGSPRKVHLAREPAKLQGGIAEPVRRVEDPAPGPGRAAERREGDGVTPSLRYGAKDRGSREARSESGDESAAVELDDASFLLFTTTFD